MNHIRVWRPVWEFFFFIYSNTIAIWKPKKDNLMVIAVWLLSWTLWTSTNSRILPSVWLGISPLTRNTKTGGIVPGKSVIWSHQSQPSQPRKSTRCSYSLTNCLSLPLQRQLSSILRKRLLKKRHSLFFLLFITKTVLIHSYITHMHMDQKTSKEKAPNKVQEPRRSNQPTHVIYRGQVCSYEMYLQDLKSGKWQKRKVSTLWNFPFSFLFQKIKNIVGYGRNIFYFFWWIKKINFLFRIKLLRQFLYEHITL